MVRQAKVVPMLNQVRYIYICIALSFLTWKMDRSEWSDSCSNCFISKKGSPNIHYVARWVGPRTSLDTTVKRKISFLCQKQGVCSLIAG
jgi:hypothetical protein